MAEAFVDRLTPLLRSGDSAAAWELLRSLDDEEKRQAKAWFAGARRWAQSLRQLDYELPVRRDGENLRPEEEDAVGHGQAMRIVAMCAISLCGPATAAQRVPWEDFWEHQRCPGHQTFLTMLRDADREWVATFAQAASEIRLRRGAPVLAETLRTALIHHQLAAPSGATFLEQWQPRGPFGIGDPETGLRLLLNDPLMPGILPKFLASGHAGLDEWLPVVMPELIAAGLADRDELLSIILSLFTAPQRPRSQAVLAGIARQLGLTADEVPGGLSYLHGVIATSDKSVVAVLLPLALELASSGESLVDVARTVAARPELAPKRLLLKHIQRPGVADAVGRPAIGDVLTLLEAGQDAKLVLQIERAARRLGVDRTGAAAAGARPARSGLWELKPAEPGPPREIGWWERTLWRAPDVAGWWRYLLRSESDDPHASWDDAMLSMVLADLFRGDFDPGVFENIARQTLADDRLAVTRLARILEHLFLAGGMSQTWPLAITIADACAAAPRRPPALHALLRLLADYAHETPTQPMPTHLAALAASPGETKAQVEARRLGALLANLNPDDYLRRLRESREPRSTTESGSARAVEPRGLWDAGEMPVSSADVRVDPVAPGLQALRAALAADFSGESYEDVSHTPTGHQRSESATSLTNPDRVLAAAVRAIHAHGADRVRGALAGIERVVRHPFVKDRRYEPVHVVAAIDLWAEGALDVEVFWRFTRDTVTQPEVGLPQGHKSAASRLHFLRACEVLLLAQRSAHPLSTPTWRDGTLDLGTLNQRLRDLDGRLVGPLDLVQALHRLRPVEPDQVAHVPAVDVRTDPCLTDPDGTTSWDAVDLVRTWVRAGGLPELRPVPVDGKWTPGRTVPISWSQCRSAPEPVRDGEWTHGALPEMARMFPLWPDRATSVDAFAGYPFYDARHFPDQMPGPFGVPLHDVLLGALNLPPNWSGRSAALSTWNVVTRRRLIDPGALVEAAVGRHAAGALPLGRITERIQRVLDAGGLAVTWPAFLPMAGALCAHNPKPSGLSGFLRLLSTYVGEVPANDVDRAVPETLRRFAASAGKSRSHAEARALVAALDRR